MATYVLVHGAYQGGWIWKPVATRLRAAGHLVYAPSLDGCADRRQALRPGITVTTHAQEVAQLLFYEDLREVVLVGTSAGGMPDRVKCLHVLAGQSLAQGRGVNPLGDEVLDLLGEWWASGPCVTVGVTVEPDAGRGDAG